MERAAWDAARSHRVPKSKFCGGNMIFSRMDALLRTLSHVGFVAASALLLIVGLLGAIDVVTTNLFFYPIRGMLELSGALLAVIVFLGLAEAQARGANIIIDIATQSMRPGLKRLSAVISLTIGFAFMALVAWHTTKLALNAWAIRETALGAFSFPLAPFKAVASFGAWLATAEFGRQLVRQLMGIESNGEGKARD